MNALGVDGTPGGGALVAWRRCFAPLGQLKEHAPATPFSKSTWRLDHRGRRVLNGNPASREGFGPANQPDRQRW
jgi:hypothetical protein